MKRASLALLILMILTPLAFGQVGASGGGRGRGRNPQLTVTSNVSGAQVTITAKGSKPVSGRAPVEESLSSGTYRVTVEASGYISQSRNVNLQRNATEHFELQEATGRIQVILDDSLLNNRSKNAAGQVEVYIDGNRLGGSALRDDVRPGRHTVELVTGGFQVQTTVTVQAGQTYRVEPVLDLRVR